MDGAPLLGAASPGGSSDEVFLAHRGRRESADDVLHNEMLASYARGWQGQRQRRDSIHHLRARKAATKEREAMYESLDYDIVETNLHVISQRSHDSRKHLAARVRVTRWVLTALAGVFTALVACGIDLGVKRLNGLKFGLTFDLIQKGKLHTVADALHYFWVPLLAFVGINDLDGKRIRLRLSHFVQPSSGVC